MKRQVPAVLIVLLAACGGGDGEVADRATSATPTPWPEEYQEWVCAASDELTLQTQSAMNDLVDATELLDVPGTIEAADQVGESAAQARDFLDLAPRWRPGNKLVRLMDRWLTQLARAANQISAGVTAVDVATIEAGTREFVQANRSAKRVTRS